MQTTPESGMYKAEGHPYTANVLVLAGYLALGAVGVDSGPLSDEETDTWEGESYFVEYVTGFAPLVAKVVEKAVAEGLDFNGVFNYEVAEELGKFIRKRIEGSTYDAIAVELLALSSKFFGKDVTSWKLEILP